MFSAARRSILLLIAMVVFGCGKAAAPSASGGGDCAELVGEWTGSDWGQVEFKGCWGGYTDTFHTGPGLIDVKPSGPRTYKGTWSESRNRHGIMELTLSEDGRTITGSWEPDPGCTIGAKTGGSVAWSRK